MQTVTMLELRLEEAQLLCETTKRKLNRKWFASFLLPEYFVYFEEKLEGLLGLIDDTLGLIATSERPLQRTEMLSRALIEEGLRAQPISLIQTMSNQGAIAHELSTIWHQDEEKMLEIEDNLSDFNRILREMQYAREHADTKWLMDWLGFPDIDNFPSTISLRLMKDLYAPDASSGSGHTIIEVPVQRLARHNAQESARPSQSRPRR